MKAKKYSEEQIIGTLQESDRVARAESYDYVEVLYDQKRPHSAIGDVSPAEFEEQHREKVAEYPACPPDRIKPSWPDLGLPGGQPAAEARGRA